MKEKEEVAKTKPTGKADKVLATQRRLEERQRQQMILEEMKIPRLLPSHVFDRTPTTFIPTAAA